jgi:hypothetical protein
MPVPDFALKLLGKRPNGVPNTADSDSTTSLAIAGAILRRLGIETIVDLNPQAAGRLLEEAVENAVRAAFIEFAPTGPWQVARRRVVSDFDQYAHLATLQRLIESDESGTLSVEIGRDYLIKPDVTVAIEQPDRQPFLHAAIACKWTIRSDRVQNIRHEGVVLTRHRRGRQPHIVTVTPEPLPTRLAAIARGTGEVDAVYHVTFDELLHATDAVGTAQQRTVLNELVRQRRLLPFERLLPTLTL